VTSGIEQGLSGQQASSEQRWRDERAYLREYRLELTRIASRLYPDHDRIGRSALLTRPAWNPTRPVELETVGLRFANRSQPLAVTGDEPEASRAIPAVCGGGAVGAVGGPARYSSVIQRLQPLRVFENRPTYCLTAVDLTGAGASGGEPSLEFTMGRYFDGMDVGEAVGHELAATVYAGQKAVLTNLPFRQLVGDPTDPSRRAMPMAIMTLTIRHDPSAGTASFLMHWRDPAKVASNGGLYTVVPVGVFQPAVVAQAGAGVTGRGQGRSGGRGQSAGWGPDQDFDLWRSMIREYSEELLGSAELYDVDYAKWPFSVKLDAARKKGACRPYCLGLGTDPVTFATDLLATVVFEAEVFDELFAGLITSNDEGEIVSRTADGSPGIPFAEAQIEALVNDRRTQPAAAATLELAWRLRDDLLAG
jgi:hypothetical protein